MENDHDNDCPLCKEMQKDIVKPTCERTGVDGNVFAIIGKVGKTLRRAGQPEKAEEFRKKAIASSSYDAVLALCFEYVDVE